MNIIFLLCWNFRPLRNKVTTWTFGQASPWQSWLGLWVLWDTKYQPGKFILAWVQNWALPGYCQGCDAYSFLNSLDLYIGYCKPECLWQREDKRFSRLKEGRLAVSNSGLSSKFFFLSISNDQQWILIISVIALPPDSKLITPTSQPSFLFPSVALHKRCRHATRILSPRKILAIS